MNYREPGTGRRRAENQISDAQLSAATWVDAFAAGWRAPVDAKSLVQHFEPWLHEDYEFVQPPFWTPGIGAQDMYRRFAKPLFDVMTDIRGNVDTWAVRNEALFIELSISARVGRHEVRLRACDRVILVGGLAYRRTTYVDLIPLLVAVGRTPTLWPALARWQRDELDAFRRSRRPHQPRSRSER